jgi:hypothetical protein
VYIVISGIIQAMFKKQGTSLVESWTFFPASTLEDNGRFVVCSYSIDPEQTEKKANAKARSKSPRNSYWLDSANGRELLDDFCTITNTENLLDFIDHWGLPAKYLDKVVKPRPAGADITQRIDVDELLQAAANFKWLLMVAEAIQSNNRARLKNWLSPVESDRKTRDDVPDLLIPLTMKPTEVDIESCLKHWNGMRILGRGEQGEGYGFCSRSDWENTKRECVTVFPKVYLSGCLNELVSDIRLKMSRDLSPGYHIETPFQAMCLALYDEVWGGTVRRCLNPNCAQFISVVPSKKDSRQRRKDRVYCDRPGCQSWVYRNSGPVRITAKNQKSR